MTLLYNFQSTGSKYKFHKVLEYCGCVILKSLSFVKQF